MFIFEIIAAVVGLFSIVLLILQIRIGVKAMKFEHHRSKQHETLNFLLGIRQLWHEALAEIDSHWGSDELPADKIQHLVADDAYVHAVRKLLGHVEHLCTAVMMDVLDEEMLFRTSASHLIAIHKRFRPFIDAAQARNPKAYCEFVSVVERFVQRKAREASPSAQ